MPIDRPARWILIGGSGFLGTNLLHVLSPDDGEAVVIDRLPSMGSLLPGTRSIEQDFREVDSYRDEIVPGSVVVHMAASSYPGKAEKIIEADIQDNIQGTVKLANACADAGAAALVFFSSGGTVYGERGLHPIPETAPTEPISAYGVMKLSCEHYLRVTSRLRGLPVAILRISNPYGRYHRGSGQGAINVFFECLRTGKPIELWGDGSQTRDFVFAEDVARAVRLVGLRFRSGCDTFNIGSGEERSINSALAAVSACAGIPPDVRRSSVRDVDVQRNCLDTARIRERFGWTPDVAFEDGLRRTWAWMATRP